MPNWCKNSIRLTGDARQLEPLVNLLRSLMGSEKLLFEHVVPLPDKPLDEKELVEFNAKNYGTRWDVPCSKEVILTEIEGVQYLSFDTDLSPPLGFCRLVAEKYKIPVYLQYGEESDDYYGNCAFNESCKELYHHEYPYKEGIYKIDPEAFWANCEYYLEDMHSCELSEEEMLDELHFLLDEDKEKVKEMYGELS